MRHLFFEDFLECIVRLACQCALPTWEEIGAAGASNAGEFLIALREYHPAEYATFVEERTGTWRTRDNPRQRVHACVDHLLALLVHKVHTSAVHGAPISDAKAVTAKGAKEFLRLHDIATAKPSAKASESHHGHHGSDHSGTITPNPLADGRVLAALDTVAERVRGALAQVGAFSGMSDAQRELLRTSMSMAKFERDEVVFEQVSALPLA